MSKKWNDEGNMSLSFDVKVNEDTVEFFQRMEREMKEREEAFEERIKQLFDETIEVSGHSKDDAYRQVLQVFSAGYQYGWNDYHHLVKANREGV